MFDNIGTHGLHVHMFRADCGSFIKELVEELSLRTETFYLCAGSCAERRRMYEQCTEWRHTVVNGMEMDVASFDFTDFLSDWHLRLVVQRAKIDTEQGEQFLPIMEYMYRAIPTNDHGSTEEQVIDKYNQRGACEKNFDVQNNDFGWAHLPFSTKPAYKRGSATVGASPCSYAICGCGLSSALFGLLGQCDGKQSTIHMFLINDVYHLFHHIGMLGGNVVVFV